MQEMYDCKREHFCQMKKNQKPKKKKTQNPQKINKKNMITHKIKTHPQIRIQTNIHPVAQHPFGHRVRPTNGHAKELIKTCK